MALVTNLDDSGEGSLRAAVQEANDNPGTTITTIDFDQGFFGALKKPTINLKSELKITKNTRINGPGQELAVSGMDHRRVFVIGLGAEVTISGLTITHGLADNSAPEFHGLGGGILNEGTLTLEKVRVSDNNAEGDAKDKISLCGFDARGAGAGGGVANLGTQENPATLTVSDSKFENNHALGAPKTQDNSNDPNDTGPGFAFGGGLANVGMATATVKHCEFTINVAQGGDGCDGTEHITIKGTSSYKANIAGSAAGGAIASFGFGPLPVPNDLNPPKNTATLIIRDYSSFSHNEAKGGSDNSSPVLPGFAFGGAIASHRFNGNAVLKVSNNCIFDENKSIGGDHNEVSTGAKDGDDRVFPNTAAGGGVSVCGNGEINASTFSNNTAQGGDGFVNKFDQDAMHENTRNGGHARGGGIEVAFNGTVVNVNKCTVQNNRAVAGGLGTGGSGGNSWGGGVGTAHRGATLTVSGGSIDHNEAMGGFGTHGQGIGGGLYYLGKTDFNPDSISNNHASTSNPDIFPEGKYVITPSTGGDGLGGGVYNDAGSTTCLIDAIKVTQNWAEDCAHHRKRILEELLRLLRELLGKLHLVTKPPFPPPSPWFEQWQAPWDNVMTVLGRVHLDPAQDKAAVYLNAARGEFDAAADLVHAARSASPEERAKLVKEIAKRVETARVSFDQFVEAAGLPTQFPPSEPGQSAQLVTTARQ